MSPLWVSVLLFVAYAGFAVSECPDYFSPWFDGNCFTTLEDDTFILSAKSCVALDGTLTSIHSKQENEWMRSLSEVDEAWIGLRCNETSKDPFWLDGTPVDFTAFAQNYSGNCNGTDAGFVLQSDGSWQMYAKGSSHETSGICKLNRKTNARCQDFEEVPNSNSCLQFGRTRLTSNRAEAACVKLNSHLVSIHDKQTNEFLVKRALELGFNEAIHIGLLSNASQKQEAWTDATVVDFNNYMRGFPLDPFGHCTMLEVSDSLWKSIHCDSVSLPYVCERQLVTPEPTTAPSGCPDSPYYTAPGEIFSPSYPHAYPANLACDYYLAAPEGQTVTVAIEDFETSTCCDTLRFYEGEIKEKLIDTLQGKVSNEYTVSTSSDNIMHLVWSPTNGGGARGWRIKFSFDD